MSSRDGHHGESIRIVVTGLAATYPLGGVFWDYIQYVLGFHRLGHDVLYLEDTGKWCYSPTRQTFVESGEENASYFERHLQTLEPELGNRWSYRDVTGRTFGRSRAEVARFCRGADLFLHVSASCWMREEYWEADRVAFIDSDPMYTQASILNERSGPPSDTRDTAATFDRYDVYFSFGERVGKPDCEVPTIGCTWRPTRQPIVLDQFLPHQIPVERRRRRMTTIASWEPTESGPVVDGKRYSGKGHEFERFMTLPESSAMPLEVAMSGKYPADRMRRNGWHVIDARTVSADPWRYRDYLAESFAEWSVAKNAYVASRSGWFSCRTACYLALGVPAIVQETEFSRSIPSGEGILAFETLDDAAAAIEEVTSRPNRHREAALSIAREHFDSDRVLTELLEVALNDATG